MNKIKFQLWSKSSGKMITWETIKHLAFQENGDMASLINWLEGDDYIPLLFTGLIDREDQEVYDGDIVGCWPPSIPIVVEYSERSAKFFGKRLDKENSWVPLIPTFQGQGSGHLGGEVLGNKYEHKDMLDQIKEDFKNEG